MVGQGFTPVRYECPAKYKEHYVRNYCKQEIFTSDRIRVHFSPGRFEHAFYTGRNDQFFSMERAQRIDLIRTALVSRESGQFFGWDTKNGADMLDRRVALYRDFVVVLEFKLGRRDTLKAEFVTCFRAHPATCEKTESSIPWNRKKAVEELKKQRRESRGRKR